MNTASDIQEILKSSRNKAIISESLPTKVQQSNLAALMGSSRALYQLVEEIHKLAHKTLGVYAHYMDVKDHAEDLKRMVPDLESCVEALKVDIQKLYEEE
jgi:hypothetical protein